MLSRARSAGLVVLGYGALAVAFTWPHALRFGTAVPWHNDPLLSIWRIAWVAHALTTGVPLADTNIFHPEARTLAYTDAVLLQGVLATPFLAAGASPTLVYNLLILASLALSAAAMHLLALRLTGSHPAAWLAGTIFGFSTFRAEHYMHLEMQALVFLPIALYFLDRAFDAGRRRDHAGLALALVLQIFSGIYYAVFLVTALGVAIPWRWWRLPPAERLRFASRLAAVAVVAALLAAPYLWLFVQNRQQLGERGAEETSQWSATPVNYLASEPRNLLHGGWSAPLGASERRLFPGVLALALAAFGLRGWCARKTTVAIVAGTGLIVSLGVNTPLYAVLRDWLVVYRGLRAPARAAILVLLAVSLLAAYGWAALLRRRPGWATRATAAALAVLALEYASRPPNWLEVPREPPALVRWLAAQPRSVVVALPLPPGAGRLDATTDAHYMQASTGHWQPLLNGYSGFYPASYVELLDRMRSFPSDESIAYLRERQVDLIVLHGRHLPEGQLGQWAWTLGANPGVEPVAEFPDERTADLVFRLRR